MANEKNLKPFKKGHKASVGHGRPKGSKTFSVALRELLETEIDCKDGFKRSGLDMLALGIFKKACKGDVNAAKEIVDRVEGKVVQKTENTTSLNLGSLNLSSLSTEQLLKIREDNRKEPA